MARSFPPDVIVLDAESLLHARFARGKAAPRLVQAKSYRLPAGTFVPAPVTPALANEGALAEAVRRLRVESGNWQRLSLLLPDSWFRMNIIDLPSFNAKQRDAGDLVRWSLKRTLPLPPEKVRVAWEVIEQDGSAVKVLAVSAVDTALAAIERLFASAGFEVILIEPLGLNLWNAVAVREGNTEKDRLFVYVRDDEFTTAVFRGPRPLFIRSRNLSGERTLEQEIRLSANYLRDTLRAGALETCYLAGNRVDGNVSSILTGEFGANVRAIALTDFIERAAIEIPPAQAELVACTGVFTA
ncbi:MAG TPA: hypothetical protein VNL91_09315 [Thermoanaerobaculia bacterium]|nr:hypothetical protein [Thermoanaerobaculia bacterium]